MRFKTDRVLSVISMEPPPKMPRSFGGGFSFFFKFKCSQTNYVLIFIREELQIVCSSGKKLQAQTNYLLCVVLFFLRNRNHEKWSSWKKNASQSLILLKGEIWGLGMICLKTRNKYSFSFGCHKICSVLRCFFQTFATSENRFFWFNN